MPTCSICGVKEGHDTNLGEESSIAVYEREYIGGIFLVACCACETEIENYKFTLQEYSEHYRCNQTLEYLTKQILPSHYETPVQILMDPVVQAISVTSDKQLKLLLVIINKLRLKIKEMIEKHNSKDDED